MSELVQKNDSHKPLEFLLLILSLAPLGYWAYLQLGQDLWWDELISIKNYALADLSTNVTVNPDMNNHIFFNLLNNLYTRLIGQRDFYELLGHPVYLRAFQLLISAGTIYYSYRFFKDFVERKSAFIVVALLVSCIPFLNFSLQLRGYALSMLLLMMMIYHTYHYLQTGKVFHLSLIAFSIFGSLFTLASNIYIVGSFYIILLISVVLQQKRKNASSIADALISIAKERIHIYTFLAVALGLLITFLAYLPTLDDLLNNRFVDNSPSDRLFVLNTRLVEVMEYLFSYRWPILLAPAIILYSRIRKKTDFSWLSLVLFTVVTLPFLLSFLHDKAPYQRTFVILAPFFNLFLGILIFKSLDIIHLSNKAKSAIHLGLVIYLSTWSFIEIESNDKQLLDGLREGRKEQNIYRNYYQASRFTPNQISRKVAALNSSKTSVLLLDEIDRVSLVFHLERFDIPSTSLVRIDNKQTKAQGNTFNRVAVIQQSREKNADVGFFSFPFNEENDTKTNKYDLMLGINTNLRNGEPVYLLTSSSKFLNESVFINQFYNVTLKDRTGFTHIYQIDRKQ